MFGADILKINLSIYVTRKVRN